MVGAEIEIGHHWNQWDYLTESLRGKFVFAQLERFNLLLSFDEV